MNIIRLTCPEHGDIRLTDYDMKVTEALYPDQVEPHHFISYTCSIGREPRTQTREVGAIRLLQNVGVELTKVTMPCAERDRGLKPEMLQMLLARLPDSPATL